jgi:hypothetical protein
MLLNIFKYHYKSWKLSAPLLIQDSRYGSHLGFGFGFRRLSDTRLCRLVQFFVAYWG